MLQQVITQGLKLQNVLVLYQTGDIDALQKVFAIETDADRTLLDAIFQTAAMAGFSRPPGGSTEPPYAPDEEVDA